LEWGTHNPASAAIFQNTDIWGNAGDDNDFNLEFMELDEFLSETGLGGVDNDLLNKATQSLVEAESASAEVGKRIRFFQGCFLFFCGPSYSEE